MGSASAILQLICADRPGLVSELSGWVAANGGARGVDRGALSLGMNYAFNLNTLFKFEYRYDWASGPVFIDTKSNDYKKSNQLFGTAVVVSF